MSRISLVDFVSLCIDEFDGRLEVTRSELNYIKSKYKCSIPAVIWSCGMNDTRPMKFNLNKAISDKTENIVPVQQIQKPVSSIEMYIPRTDKNFCAFGTNYKLIDNVISRNIFFPIYIWGVSGVGKTLQIEQACAKHNKPLFRCQITKDTVNEDLIGSYSLIDGNTVWIDGPVLKAYRLGGILLLDEIDLNPSLMILQGVLENKPVYVSQTSELVYPEFGFNVFATGNTKGDGAGINYVGTSVLNEAFLERFVAIIEQKIPTIAQETSIIKKYIANNDIQITSEVFDYFIKWIDLVRSSYLKGDIEIYLSSRRIQYILQIFAISGNFDKSIMLVLSRYSDDDVDCLVKMWLAIKHPVE